LSGFHTSVWSAFWAPKGTPKNIIEKLNAAVVTVLADPAARQWTSALGDEIVPREQQTPEALGTLQRSEIKKWWPIIRAAGIRAR
jgi:tripartite-type tricarboxylate transporter receptor subunit TctC